MSVELGRPEWLFLLLLLPVWLWWILPDRATGFLVPRAGRTVGEGRGAWWRRGLELVPLLLRVGGAVALVLVLAQPQLVRVVEEPVEEGAGIAVAIDLSTSMWADDMEGSRTRLEAAKETVLRFVAGRSDDIGLVTFAGEALTRLPLTDDHYLVERAVEELEVGLLIDGTDIAGAIAAGAALLEDATHESKVLILVTDGAHNRDGLLPATAARAAAAYGVRVYPIAIGQPPRPRPAAGAGARPETSGPSRPTPQSRMETVLTQAARMTGGQYYSARDVAALDSIYAEIDRLEARSTQTRATTAASPLALWLLLGAIASVVGASGLRSSRWGVIP